MQHNSRMVIDLSDKSPAEIAEFMQSLLSARRLLLKKGLTLKISRRRLPRIQFSKKNRPSK